MRRTCLLLALIPLLVSCASQPFVAGAQGNLCRIEGEESWTLKTVDGQPAKVKKGILDEGAPPADLEPGRHELFWTRGRTDKLTLSFACKPAHRYKLREGEAGADIYGARKRWMVEDADTKEVVAAQK